MKQKLRKFTNGFYPNAGKDTDTEEMADTGSDSFLESDNKDTVDRLSQLLSNIKSNHKLFTGEDHCEIISQLKEEIRSEQAWLSSLNHDIDTVAIYKVAQWTREKIETELAQYKVFIQSLYKFVGSIESGHIHKTSNQFLIATDKHKKQFYFQRSEIFTGSNLESNLFFRTCLLRWTHMKRS